MFQTQIDIMKRVGFNADVNMRLYILCERSQFFKLIYFKDINLVFILLSAILHLTNIKFCDDDETDGVYINDEYPLKLGRFFK